MSRPRKALVFENSTTRAYDGAIVTFVNRINGELRVVHRAGFAYDRWTGRVHSRDGGERVKISLTFLDVIRLLCTEADAWVGDWKIVTICTPSSIYSDLTHRRSPSQGVPNYEASTLARAGRIDMWDGEYTREHRERNREKFGQARLPPGPG